MRWLLILTLLLSRLSFSQVSDTVQTTTLKNGMKVLVQEDHSILGWRCTFFTAWVRGLVSRYHRYFPFFRTHDVQWITPLFAAGEFDRRDGAARSATIMHTRQRM